MGRSAKCRICGTALDTDVAYKIITNGKNFYYCSEIEYKTDKAKKEKDKQDHDKVYRLICEIIGRNEIINTILYKEWAVWGKIADNEKIGQYLEENNDYLRSVVSKLEDKEFNRIRYVSAILKNKLSDYRPRVMEEPKPKVETNMNEMMYEIHNTNKNKRKSLADLEDMF